MHTGQRLKQAREALPAETGPRRKGKVLQREELAARVGITPGRLKGWEDGGIPESDVLVRLADELGVSLDWLLAGRGRGPTT